ncbi:hypothetical protein GCM10010965_25700 [Caldalkalibacillus thermarum]|uniref:hypothetical protein n=1 Tax=Caldalkalibacillus thermarum TaxID=296745 RepID=UPI0016674625|nr:hypothetical protein [Caldalkalibacillus thermarum]GGK31713.1 hypothetical protein GCM10010965_25700 [Caldalkalibacillus thermarum]
MRLPVKVKGKVIGYTEKGVFIKPVKSSRHYFEKYDGYAVQASVVPTLRRRNVHTIRLIEDGTREYTISLADFLRHGKLVDYGHGEQIVCPLEYWTGDAEPQEHIEQLALF